MFFTSNIVLILETLINLPFKHDSRYQYWQAKTIGQRDEKGTKPIGLDKLLFADSKVLQLLLK